MESSGVIEWLAVIKHAYRRLYLEGYNVISNILDRLPYIAEALWWIYQNKCISFETCDEDGKITVKVMQTLIRTD